MKRLLLILFAIFLIASPVQGEFFKDVIVTSPTGIWTDSRAYTTLNAAVAAIGANEQDLYIAKEEVVTTLTIPANIRLHFLKGGAIANSNTLSINTKNIHADHQIFTGAGAVNFIANSEVRSRWFEDFETAITQTSNDTVTLTVDTADTLLNSAAVGDNVLLKWNASNLITIAAGQTLSNIGDISAPSVRLFVISGAITFRASSSIQEIDANWFGSSLTTLGLADAAAAAAGKSLTFSGPWVIDTDLTLSSNLKVLSGTDLQIATTMTLTINGSLDAGLYQIFSCTGTGAVAGLDVVLPEWFGGANDNSTDNTTPFAKSLEALNTNGTLELQSGIYRGWIASTYSDITIKGKGSSSTIIKLPDAAEYTVDNEAGNPITGVPNVIDIGETSRGNNGTAVNNVTVIGLTVDGNYTGTTAPTEDVFGYGVTATLATRVRLFDVIAQNCWLSGIAALINSEYFQAPDLYAYKCGMAIEAGSILGAGFRMDQCNYCKVNIVADQCMYGLYVANGEKNNIINAIIYNPTSNAAKLFGQTATPLNHNIINITCESESDVGGILFGNGTANSVEHNFINITVKQLHDGLNIDEGVNYNNIKLSTYYSYATGLTLSGNYNNFEIISNLDGRSGAQGDSFAIDVSGDYNKIAATVIDSGTWQVRGIYFRAGATGNHLSDYRYLNTGDPLNDSGTNTIVEHGSGISEAVASGATINIPFNGSHIPITGTADITSIFASSAHKGRTITLVFSGTAAATGLTNGGNLMLSADLGFTPNDTITLTCDGTNWIELGRSVN